MNGSGVLPGGLCPEIGTDKPLVILTHYADFKIDPSLPADGTDFRN